MKLFVILFAFLCACGYNQMGVSTSGFLRGRYYNYNGTTRPQCRGEVCYSYSLEFIPELNVTNELTDMGADGWEIVSYERATRLTESGDQLYGIEVLSRRRLVTPVAHPAATVTPTTPVATDAGHD